jgi:phosphate transport system protein
MSRSLDPMMKDLRELALRMGSRAEAILDKALRALHDRNPALAEEVAGDDLEIDRLDVAIDQAVLRALALQSPVAEDLREVIAVKMVANDLERVGDLARNIAKSAVRLSGHADQRAPDGLEELAQRTQRVLRLALDAFTNIDADLAREVLAEDDYVDDLEEEVVRSTLRAIPSNPDAASESVDFILVAKNLERAADHATNIAEDAILVAEARNVKHAEKLRTGS